MPNIKVKTEYINKLKQFGVYDQWLENVKNQWDEMERIYPISHNCLKDSFGQTLHSILAYAFVYTETPEGTAWWNHIRKLIESDHNS